MSKYLNLFFLKIIRIYQKYLSFDSGLGRLVFINKTCRFEPTCSEYAYQAISKYGILSGCFLGLRRILRCHPWNNGGYDPLK